MAKTKTEPKPAKKKHAGGRPRNNPIGPDGISTVATSYAAAERMWGIPTSELRRAKLNGCPGFTGCRIYRDKLVEWLEANPRLLAPGDDESKEALECQRLKVQIETLRTKLDVAKGELIERGVAKDEWARAVGIFQDEAKGLMEPEIYAVWCQRCKSKIGEFEKPTTDKK